MTFLLHITITFDPPNYFQHLLVNIPQVHTFYIVFLVVVIVKFPPVHEVCTNHDVVMFQTWTGTSPDLCSAGIVILISSLFCPTWFNRFLYLRFLPRDLLLPLPHLPLFEANALSMLHHITPTNYPGRQASFHLDLSSTCQPQPIVPTLTSFAALYLFLMSLLSPRVLFRERGVPILIHCCNNGWGCHI